MADASKAARGAGGEATIRFGEAEFPVPLRINTAAPEGPYIELVIRRCRDERTVTYEVRLVWTVPPYGGRRWWFVCPRSYRRVAKLYLPNGGHYFWSRKAYGLGYGVQREPKLDQRMRMARKLSYALGADGDIDVPLRSVSSSLPGTRPLAEERARLSQEAVQDRRTPLAARRRYAADLVI
jgi:hypothetical protein